MPQICRVPVENKKRRGRFSFRTKMTTLMPYTYPMDLQGMKGQA